MGRLTRILAFVAFGASNTLSAQGIEGGSFPDQGAAFAACQQAMASVQSSGTFDQWGPREFRQTILLACPLTPAPFTGAASVYHCSIKREERAQGAGEWNLVLHNGPCVPPGTSPNEYRFDQSCATRPDIQTSWTGGEDVLRCANGCEMSSVGAAGVIACTWSTVSGRRTYTCAGPIRATGATCAPAPDTTSDPPSDPDRDGDGTPNDSDGAPDDPACQTNCGPPPPPNPDQPNPQPEPETPDDGQDDGQRVTSELSPKLDAIKQSVDALGPRLDALTTAVNTARSDANADADRIVTAINGIQSGAPANMDGVQAAIERIGRCVGRGPGDNVVDECDNMATRPPEGNTVSGGGNCSSAPVCTGDPAQCAMVRFAWQSACANITTADEIKRVFDERNPPVDGPESPFAGDPNTDGLVDTIWADGDLDVDLDESGFGGGGSCPLVSLSIPGLGPIDTQRTCLILRWLGTLFFAVGALWSLHIVWTR